jgi:hypothetical protein
MSLAGDIAARYQEALALGQWIEFLPGKPENRKTGKPENRKTGKPENRYPVGVASKINASGRRGKVLGTGCGPGILA